MNIFIVGTHWWHHRGYHQRYHRHCYKDVWNRNASMTCRQRHQRRCYKDVRNWNASMTCQGQQPPEMTGFYDFHAVHGTVKSKTRKT